MTATISTQPRGCSDARQCRWHPEQDRRRSTETVATVPTSKAKIPDDWVDGHP